MKKFFISLSALVMCVAIAGCGNNAGEMTINNLGSQLDETSNIISSVQTVNPSDINLTKDMLETIATKENSAAIYDNLIGTQQTLLNEEYYKTDILSRTAKLKSSLSKDIKLSKAQTNAIKELTNNLEKYSNSVAYTENDMSSTLRQIASLKKNVEKNSDKINAKLNRLACNSNARSSYYENIIYTLAQIDEYISPQDSTLEDEQNDTTCPECNQEQVQNTGNNTQTEQSINSKATASDKANENQEIKPTPYTKLNSNNFNRMMYPYGYGMGYGYPAPYGPYQMGNGFYGANGFGMNRFGMNGFGGVGYNGANGFGYGMNGYAGMNGAFGTPYAYGGMNGNNINFARFNPNRNTDTYAPLVRNIDTYRAGTQASTIPAEKETPILEQSDELAQTETEKTQIQQEPEQRLEDFEKVNEDNIVEKQDSDDKKQYDSAIEISLDEAKKEEQILKNDKSLKTFPNLLISSKNDPPVVAH